ncbi:NifB/NifX family molybdenum-iron cluster-binding protein [Imhoffiella purpurea]|uniref:NifX protein n=1 Tax=Imhoffiella purpurea TaxID=1249627 RepID=W9V8U3_9GAMM|nr:NifB/NifX family molybdenum-iron cluster-binding protein [Imhoffiella purpurea]EXJ15824.1 NifX protein [Imhoffiella purpurea]
MTETGHIRVAIATNDLLQANAHFAAAKQLVIYDVSETSHAFLDCIQFKRRADGAARGPGGGRGCAAMGDPSEGVGSDIMQERIAALEGCAMLFCKGLSDLHAVDVYNRDVYPVKMETAREIPEVIQHVQRMISRPPLWMRRALGTEPAPECAMAC